MTLGSAWTLGEPFLRSYAFDTIGIFAHNQQLVLLQVNEELDRKDVI